MGVTGRLYAASLAVAVVASGCSFLFVRVPDRPPAPQDCPSIPIAADAIGTGIYALGTAGAAYSLSQNDLGALAGVVTVPMLLLYGTSLWYGLSERSDCHRLQEEEAADREQQQDAARSRDARELALRMPNREDVVGDAPIFCFESESQLGACSFVQDECTAAAIGAGKTCDQRTQAWCFDVTEPAVDGMTLCAPTRADCDGRRQRFVFNKSLIVSTCGQYTMRSPPPAP